MKPNSLTLLSKTEKAIDDGGLNEKKYAQRQFTDIDGYLSENKTSKANSTLGNFLATYESFAIPLPDIEEKIASYEGVLSPKIKREKYFEDGVYQRKD